MTRRPLRAVQRSDQPAPRVDDASLLIVRDAVDALAQLRTPYWLGDSTVHLHALASLIAHAQRLLPQAVANARDQGHTWKEISQLLNTTPAAAARRYRPNR